MLKRPILPESFQEKVHKDRVRERGFGCVISSWTFVWLVDGDVIGSQHHQPSGFNCSGVYVLMGSVQWTSSTWWGFQYLQNSSKDMAQSIICGPSQRTKGPWFCLMAKELLFFLAWLFSFLSASSHFSDSIYSLTKIFLQTKVAQGLGRGLFWEGLIRSCSVTWLPLSGW